MKKRHLYWTRYGLLLALGAAVATAQSPNAAYRCRLDSLHGRVQAQVEDDPQQAIALGREVLALAQSQEDSLEMAAAYLDIGLGFENCDAYDKSLEYYFKGLELYETLDHRPCIAKALNCIGFIYWYLSDYQLARSHYDRSLALYTEIGDSAGVAMNLNHMGLLHWAQGEHDQALRDYTRALALFEAQGNTNSVTALLNNIGLAYQDKGAYLQALSYFNRALKINQKIGKKWSLIENHNNIGRVYILLPDFAKAQVHLRLARRMAQEIESRYLLADNHQHFFLLYQRMGDAPKALAYHKLYTALRDSLTSNRVRANSAAIRTQYEVEKRESEIKLLKAETALAEQRLRAHRQWIAFLVAISSLIFIASVIFLIQRINIARAYRHLVEKNMEITQSEKRLRHFRSGQAAWETDEQDDAPEADEESHHKYSGSALTEAQKVKIQRDLERLMEASQYFLNHDITISGVAEELSISRTYLSQVVNEKFGMSFVNYINQLRIREARHLLSEDLDRLYTIESISKQVGFNSTNVFNKAFKRFTGLTPSFYIKTLQAQHRG